MSYLDGLHVPKHLQNVLSKTRKQVMHAIWAVACLNCMLALQRWCVLKPSEIDCLRSADDEALMLRRTAIVTEQWLHVFDLDAATPKCSIYSPFPHSYKVKLQHNNKVKNIPVKGAAWSPTLGKDTLPQSLLHSRLYSTANVVVMLKHAGTYQLCSPMHDIVTAPGPTTSQLGNLGLVFGVADYVKDVQPRQQQPRAKRGRPPGRKSGKSLFCCQNRSKHLHESCL